MWDIRCETAAAFWFNAWNLHKVVIIWTINYPYETIMTDYRKKKVEINLTAINEKEISLILDSLKATLGNI